MSGEPFGAYMVIRLNRGYEAIVDINEAHKLSGVKWSVLETGGLCYARRTIRTGKKQKTILMHRVIMGASDDQMVDHINGNGLDCRKENMRIVTKAQNNINKRVKSTNRLGIKGVRKHSLCNKFMAEIKPTDGKRVYLGLFNTVEEASLAYEAAAKKYHGEYRRHK